MCVPLQHLRERRERASSTEKSRPATKERDTSMNDPEENVVVPETDLERCSREEETVRARRAGGGSVRQWEGYKASHHNHTDHTSHPACSKAAKHARDEGKGEVEWWVAARQV